ncbi:collagen alpha-1(I) chain-like [Suricata suricatta]|uniref:collagen alpha-1(I) chain-like n=1 Tax=Suricata suricatta TaxID=37032 RepID=UPI0011568B96|nr:collagen alpha-1(I) chain-like [Suricata suricatta]
MAPGGIAAHSDAAVSGATCRGGRTQPQRAAEQACWAPGAGLPHPLAPDNQWAVISYTLARRLRVMAAWAPGPAAEPPRPAPLRSGWPNGPPVNGCGRAGLPGNSAEGGAGPGGPRGPRPRGAGFGGAQNSEDAEVAGLGKRPDSPEEIETPRAAGLRPGVDWGGVAEVRLEPPALPGRTSPAPRRAAHRGGPGAEGWLRNGRLPPSQDTWHLRRSPWARHSRCAQGTGGYPSEPAEEQNGLSSYPVSGLLLLTSAQPRPGLEGEPLSRTRSPAASPNLGRPCRPAHLAPPGPEIPTLQELTVWPS